ncbi:ATP-binding protein [Candidatus Nitronereus thalassa]|uniref:histidine kinase n=1 Tax=Candidatus Nitronereus thalassa TaxID=3020898 RepID=A0ABU3KBH7_9BACT|nr:ATP-binding protein [Candidatus Nitronereus thalassa]MDT7043584.1 ATP-binding protein [Candidatus Nitronereus thalassa]
MPHQNIRLPLFLKPNFGIRASFAGIIALYVITMVGMVVYTLMTFQSQRSDAVVIDLAGRQRMLNTRHMMQILLVSHGGEADYHYTRRILDETLKALTYGGEAVINLGEDETEKLPPAPTQDIRQILEQQHDLIQQFTFKADAFLKLAVTDPPYQDALKELRGLYVDLHNISEDAVKMLSRASRDKVTEMLEGQIVVGVMVGLLGILLTLQVTRVNRERERETLERQKAQEDLRHSEAQVLHALRQSDTLKSALLSSVSHELRTPLTSIKAMVSRALDSSQEESSTTRKEYLNSINQEIDHLTRLVENLLDMSRIEAGTLQPKRDWELFEDLVEGAINSLGKSLRARELLLDLEDDLPPIFIDGVQIQQVLANLLDNAIKYSRAGSAITLQVVRVDDSIEARVSNTGEGITPTEIPKIFERFYRVRSRGDRSIRGTGLGLAICKSIIEAHGGRIWVESVPEHTTRFIFTIPLNFDNQKPGPPGPGAEESSHHE